MSLLESPVQIGLIGGLLLCLVFAIWWHTGHRSLLIALLAMFALTIVAIGVERYVETRREAVIRTLYEAAAQVGQDDPLRLLDYLHSSASDVRARARAQLEYYELESARITQIWSVEVDTQRTPPQAIADFNASISGATRSGYADRGVLRFTVTLQPEGGQWKVLDYQYSDPVSPLRR